MRKVYVNNDLSMYFKKKHCRYCGHILEIKKTKRIVTPYDSEYGSYCMGRCNIPDGDLLVIGKDYYCPHCERIFLCQEQSKITRAQKFFGKKIVSEEEIAEAEHQMLMKRMQLMLKLRWMLLIPFFGSLAYLCMIAAGMISEIEEPKDMKILHCTSIGGLLVSLCIEKLILHFGNIDGNSIWGIVLGIVLEIMPFWMFNLPMLIYITHRCKQ